MNDRTTCDYKKERSNKRQLIQLAIVFLWRGYYLSFLNSQKPYANIISHNFEMLIIDYAYNWHYQ
jgi:hypothetical protein